MKDYSDHVFEQGAMVIPGDISYDLNYYAVKLTSFTDSAAVGVTLNDFVGLTLTGASSGVKGRVVKVSAQMVLTLIHYCKIFKFRYK